MALDLFALALRLTTAGVREATRGLQDVDAQGAKAGRTLAVVEANSVRASTSLTQLGTTARGAATGLQAKAAAATAAGTATRLLAGAVGLFAGGAALTAVVTLGLRLITAAYKALADQTSEATKRADEFTAALLRQAKARFEATVEGQRAEAARALLNEQMAAQGLAEVGPRWFGNRNVFDAAKRRLDDAVNARIEADHKVTEAVAREAAKQVTSIDKVTTAYVRAAKASEIRVPHIPGVNFKGLKQFERGEGEGDSTLPQESDALRAIFAARQAARDAAEAAKKEALTAAEELQAYLSGIFANAFVNGIIQGFQAGGVAGAFKQITQGIIAGMGQMFAAIAVKAIAASKLMATITKFLVANPVVALAGAIALMALASSMGGRGGAGGFAGSSVGGSYGSGTEEITRLKFINRDGSGVNVTPRPNYNFTIIGANDPAVNRQFAQMLENHNRR